jgi:hypothetical protein
MTGFERMLYLHIVHQEPTTIKHVDDLSIAIKRHF